MCGHEVFIAQMTELLGDLCDKLANGVANVVLYLLYDDEADEVAIVL